MSNGKICCLTGVCCDPGSPEQREAWIAFIAHERPAFTPVMVAAAADRVLIVHHNFADVVGLIDHAGPQ